MKKVIINIAMSLDGYISNDDPNLKWISGNNKENDKDVIDSFNKFYETVDSVVLGENTYLEIINHLAKDNWPYKGKDSYILTKEKLEVKCENIFLENTDIKSLITNIKNRNTKNIWVMGGANVIAQAINQKIVDEIRISIVPIILKGKIRLFDSINSEIKLNLKSVEVLNGFINTIYKVN